MEDKQCAMDMIIPLLLLLFNLTQSRVTWEEGTSNEIFPPLALPTGKSVRHFNNE